MAPPPTRHSVQARARTLASAAGLARSLLREQLFVMTPCWGGGTEGELPFY